MTATLFRDLPGVQAVEAGWQNYERLMKDEIEELERAVDAVSLELFGITEAETVFPTGNPPQGVVAWNSNFEFLEFEYDEENAFWATFGLNLNDYDGNPLACIEAFGRQLVCAIKGLHPRASIRFRADMPKTDEQLTAEAEAWGRALARD